MRALERTSIRLVTFTAPTSSTKTTPPHEQIQRAPHVANQIRLQRDDDRVEAGVDQDLL